jgi:uncharacterized protein (TIGR02246 family)
MSHRFRMSLLLVSLTIAPASHAVGQNSNDADERRILRLEAEGREATIKNDLEANDRLLADDWININPDGSVTTKARLMELIKAGSFKIMSIKNDEVAVRVYGDAAVVTGRSTSERAGQNGEAVARQVRFTRVYVRRQGRWRLATSHNTLIMTGQEKKERSQSGGGDEVRLIHKVDAAYPQEAKDKGVGGKVIVEFTIDEKGDLIDARVKEGPEPLREAALDAARQARFSNPLNRKFTGTLAYDFRLGEDKGKKSSPAAQPSAPKAAAEEPRIKLIERVEPVYPREAEEKGITGKVTVQITIGEEGEVSEAKVKEGPQELRQAAIDAVRKWRFSNPAKQKVVATIEINFEP